MTDTLKRLAGPLALTTSAATVYTVPGSTVATVTSIHVANESGASALFTLSIGTDGAGKRFFFQIPVLNQNAFDWAGTLVLAATEIIAAYSDTATALTLTISGIETT